MSITLEFYPTTEKSTDHQPAAVLFKHFNDEMNQALQSGESSPFIAFNASECIAFQIANLSFMKALTLARFVNKDVDQQINEMIKEHLQWARKRLYYGLCCYVNDTMYPTIADSPVYVRDLAACFRMAVFNKAIIANVHDYLAQFIEAQPIETVMLAVSNFEQESETLALMRRVHQLAIKTLYADCCEWYKESFPAWNPEFVRLLEYSYQHYMWLDTHVIMQPATQNYHPTNKRVPIMCPKFMINPMMAEALARFEFLKVEIPSEPRPTFNKIQICNMIFERTIQEPNTEYYTKEKTFVKHVVGDQQTNFKPGMQKSAMQKPDVQNPKNDTNKSENIPLVDKFDALLMQIKQCQLKLQAPVKHHVSVVKSTLSKDIQKLLESLK